MVTCSLLCHLKHRMKSECPLFGSLTRKMFTSTASVLVTGKIQRLTRITLLIMLRSSSVRSNLTLLAQGISRFNISKNKVMELSVPVPSAVEQKQLGQYFTKLDSLITLHQRMCSIFCFCAFGSRTNFNQSSKDSFGYYATSVPCRRCARCHRHWLQAPLTSPRRLRFRFFLRWRFDRLASARKNSTISLMRCRSGSLSSPLRGSVACVSRVLDSGRGARLPCRISGAVGLRANHEEWRRARKSRRQT